MPTKTHRNRPLHPARRALVAVALLCTVALLGGCATKQAQQTPSEMPSASTAVQGVPVPGAATAGAQRTGAPSSMDQVLKQNAETTIDSTSTGSGPVVLYDVAHLEIFGPKNTSDLGASAAVARMRKAGLRVVANHDPYTDEMLKGVSGVIISGNMRPIGESEIAALRRFMERGGIVLVTVHIAPMAQNLVQPFGMALSGGVLQTTQPRSGDTAEKLVCTNIEKSRLTEGVNSIRVLGAWAVAVQSPSVIVVGTGKDAWLDQDNNGSLGTNDMQGPFGMIAERQVGKGVIIVSGDDAVFANIALASTDNLQLFDNIIKAFKEPQ
jgi:hypothetical protein